MTESVRTIKVLEVPPTGEIRVREMADEVETFQKAVGGYIESIVGNGWGAYVNEEGKQRALPMNPRAQHIATELGWRPVHNDYLVGTVLFVGPYETEVPQFVVETAKLHMSEPEIKAEAAITGRRVGKFM